MVKNKLISKELYSILKNDAVLIKFGTEIFSPIMRGHVRFSHVTCVSFQPTLMQEKLELTNHHMKISFYYNSVGIKNMPLSSATNCGTFLRV